MDPIPGSTLLDAIPRSKSIGSKTDGLIPWANHQSAWTFLYMKGAFLCMKVREFFSSWKELFSAWKCLKISLHERNFSLHESAWNFPYMKETFLYMKVHELFSTWKKIFFAWKCVNLKITLLHYNLSSMWFAIKDNTCLLMPKISPFGLDGKANLSYWELSSNSFALSCILCILSHLISLL